MKMTWDPDSRRITSAVLDNNLVAARGVHVGETKDARYMLDVRNDTLFSIGRGSRKRIDTVAVIDLDAAKTRQIRGEAALRTLSVKLDRTYARL